MSNVDWKKVFEAFERETETLDGGGVIVSPSGEITSAPGGHRYLELVGDLESGEVVFDYDNANLNSPFREGGFLYIPHEPAETAHPDYLQYHAGDILDSGHRVFLGAQTIKVAETFDDDVEDTTDLVLGEDYQYEPVGWLLIVRDEGE